MQLPEHLYQLVVPDLMQVFPPLATGIIRRDNLPLQLTSFIGREKAIEEVIDLLHKHRLVTIHGSGGTGKTRLSEEVAAHVLESYPDGVWLVELAPLADAEKIPELITATLKLYDSRNRPALDLLIDYLSDKHMLLLLDNCEHLINACARAADRLLHECPQLSFLATSREALGYLEKPLSVPLPYLSRSSSKNRSRRSFDTRR
jgi:predicted ATPase